MRDLEELKLWLEGKEPVQINWRVNPENRAQVAEFVSQYGETEGGKAPSWMISKINREREIAAQIIEDADRDQKERENLIAAVKADYLANGGTEKSFNARQASILESYAVSGRSREILDRAEIERRSKAAWTF